MPVELTSLSVCFSVTDIYQDTSLLAKPDELAWNCPVKTASRSISYQRNARLLSVALGCARPRGLLFLCLCNLLLYEGHEQGFCSLLCSRFLFLPDEQRFDDDPKHQDDEQHRKTQPQKPLIVSEQE